MNATEVHKLSDQELTEHEQRLRKELYDLRSKAVTQTLDNPAQLGQIRKDIARLNTERRQRQTATVKA